MATAELYRPQSGTNVGNWSKRYPARLTLKEAGLSISTASWWTMLLCSTTAILVSGYLAWAYFTSSGVAGCGGGNGTFACEHVLHTRWSKVLSIPVSLPAIAIHAMVLTLLFLKPVSCRMKKVRWALLGFAALSAGGAALWFTGVQVFWIGHLCPYCLVAHSSGLVLATVFLLSHPLSWKAIGPVTLCVGVGLASLVLLQILSAEPIQYQVIDHVQSNSGSATESNEEEFLFEPPASSPPKTSLWKSPVSNGLQAASLLMLMRSDLSMPLVSLPLSGAASQEAKAPERTVQVLNNVKLAPGSWPLLGDEKAEMIFVEMFDYTCEHCQRTHSALHGAQKKFGDRLAIIALPVPMDGKCNTQIKVTEASHAEACDLAKLAIAVWMVDRSKFQEFHDYLFTKRPKLADAKVMASTTVDAKELQKILDSTVPGEFIAKHLALYQKAGAGTIPKLMFSKTTVVGAIESSESMIQILERHLK